MIKVTNVIKYKDVLVTEAKVAFIKATFNTLPSNVYVKSVGYHPILISETEKIEEGDWVYHVEDKVLIQAIKVELATHYSRGIQNGYYYKVLALPEHFSPELGSVKEGDKLYLQCADIGICKEYESEETNCTCKDNCVNYIVDIDDFNTYKIEEKMYTREEVYNIIRPIWAKANCGVCDFPISSEYGKKVFDEWFEQNVK